MSKIDDFFSGDIDLSSQFYGDKEIFTLDFTKLYDFDEDYAIELLNHPLTYHKELEQYICGKAERKMSLRLVNLPITSSIHDLKDKVMKTVVQVYGTVVQRSKPLMRVTKLHFTCKMCGETEELVIQDEQYRKYPKSPCINCEGRRWIHDYNKSEFTNYQEIYIQELIENTPNGSSPDKVKVILTGSLIRSCEPGENVMVVGILEAYDSSSKSVNIEVDYHIEATSLINSTEADTINLTEEDKKHIQLLLEQPDHMTKIIQSIAPTIYGLETIKEALAYQLCEGQVKHINEERKRGQFHILLAGPPGTGKSELGDFMVKCHPKGRKAIGRGASAVGLTASVVKEGEQFVLKAGAMPMADNGFLFIDEIEKMSQSDSGAMHPGMEQQEINIDKADISAVLKTRCSILAACNPLGGVWNDNKYPIQNLHDGDKGLSLTLLDRFALTFIIKQNMDTDLETDVIKHIMRVNSDALTVQPPYDLQMLRKTFAYARSIEVTLTKEVAESLEEFCIVLFEACKTGELAVITRRLPYDLIRLSEASARIHGRTQTVLEDGENAKRMVAKSLREYGVDPLTGKVNQMDALYGEPRNKRQMIKEAPQIITRLCSHNIDTSKVNRVEFVDYAAKTWRVSLVEVGDILDVLLKDGTVYCPTPYSIAVSQTQPQSLNTLYGTEEGEGHGEQD